MDRPRSHLKIYLFVTVLILAASGAMVAAKDLRSLEALAQIKDDVLPANARLSGPSRLEAAAQIKDDMIPVDARLTGPSRLEVLAQVKDVTFAVNAHFTGPSRLEELARIKDDLIY